MIYEFVGIDSEDFAMRALPPELLRSFVAIARTKSFTVAADRVSLSQSTVSHHIRRLEELLGQPLFDRDTRNVHLSRAGESLLHYAEHILAMMDEAISVVSGPPLHGSIRLGLSEDFASARLTAALASFIEHNPNVELAIATIATGLSGDLFRELDENKHDLVFAKRLSGSHRGQVVRTEPLCWCGGPKSPLYGVDSVLPLALHPEPSVSRARVLETLKAAGRPYRIVVTSSSIAVVRAAVMSGLGISAFAGYVIPEGLVRLDEGLPALGELDYVIDRPQGASRAVLALETVLASVAQEL
jgi:DNA-binding transcriptional LysR family regulator